MLQRLKTHHITILVSTPYMDEASLCDRVALIQGGKILSVGTPQSIAASFPHSLYGIKSERMFPLLQDLRACEGVHSVHPFGEFYHVSLSQNADIQSIISFLKNKNHRNLEHQLINAGIEDVFMELM
jgi:ABC-type multidrug transport system ATPase subunit